MLIEEEYQLTDYVLPNGLKSLNKHVSHSAIYSNNERSKSIESKRSSTYRSHSGTSSSKRESGKVRVESIEVEPWVRQMEEIDAEKPTLMQELILQASIRKMEDVLRK